MLKDMLSLMNGKFPKLSKLSFRFESLDSKRDKSFLKKDF